MSPSIISPEGLARHFRELFAQVESWVSSIRENATALLLLQFPSSSTEYLALLVS